MIKVNRKIFKILYRLTLPGSLLLVFSALLIRVGVLADPQAPIVRFYPVAVFGMGLALSAFFRRSRLFFALLALVCPRAYLPGYCRGYRRARPGLLGMRLRSFCHSICWFWRFCASGVLSPLRVAVAWPLWPCR